MLALLGENGPCSVNETDGTTHLNPYSWTTAANVIWIDQPAGAGFSYADKTGYDTNQTQVSRDVYRFLQAFLKANPQFIGRDTFITGESYGGHYVPSISWAIYEGNAGLPSGDDVYIPLTGFAIGNGLTDPLVQYAYYGQVRAAQVLWWIE